MKTLKNYFWAGCGFPVMFPVIPAIEFQGELIPNVNWKEVEEQILVQLCKDQKTSLTGAQVKFIRNFFDMTLREFGSFIGVTHTSVKRWENCDQDAAKIDQHIEIMIRIYVLEKLHHNTDEAGEIIQKIRPQSLKPAQKKSKPLEVDLH